MSRNVGCTTCRLRKVKCTGPPAPCDKCRRLQLDCSFDAINSGTRDNARQPQLRVPTETRTEAGTVRQRALVACRECRIRKARCGGQRPKCNRCSAWNLPCVYEHGRQRASLRRSMLQPPPGSAEHHATSAAPESVSPDVATDRLFLARDIVARHIEAYFEYVYPLPGYDFFHRSSLLEDLNDDKIPAALSSAICASASTYVACSKEARQVSIQWTKDLDKFIFSTLNSLQVLNLQLMVLSIFQHYVYRQFGRVWLMHGLATRLALSLQLNKPKPSNPDKLTLVRRECARRLVWGLFIHDKIHSGGVKEFTCIPARWMLISLPTNENSFQSEIELPTGTLESFSAEALGIGGYLAILHKLRYEIISATKRVITRNMEFSAREIEETLSSLSQLRETLTAFYNNLPQYLQLSDRNIFSHSSKPSLTSYIALHTWYFQASCDLFRISLPGLSRESAPSEFLKRTPRDFVCHWRRLCVSSALTMAKMWARLLELKRSRILKLPGDLLHLSPESCVSIHQCTKILLIARSYEITSDLFNPLNNEPLSLNDQLIDELCQSNVAFLDGLASIIPIAAVVQRDVNEMLVADRTDPRRTYIAEMRPPVTSHVQLDKALSRYNSLAMGISATSDELHDSDYSARSSPPRVGGAQGRQGVIPFDFQWKPLTDPQPPLQEEHQQQQQQQNLTMITTSGSHLQHGADFSATAWEDCGMSAAVHPGCEFFLDYSVPTSEYDMRGELDMFFMDMPPLQDRCL